MKIFPKLAADTLRRATPDMRPLRFALRAALVLMLAAPGLAHAGDAGAQALRLRVDVKVDGVDRVPGDGLCRTASGHCSLRAAVMEANASSGTVLIAVPPGRFSLTLRPPSDPLALQQAFGVDAGSSFGSLKITHSVTIQGAGPGRTVIDGRGRDRVVVIPGFPVPRDATTTVTLSGLTLTGGDARRAQDPPQNAPSGGGGGLYSGSPVTLLRVSVEGNVADTAGGIFYGSLSKSMLMRSVTVHRNTSTATAGGIRLDGGARVENSTISGNRTIGTGGGVDVRGAGLFDVTFVNSTIAYNTATSGGAGIKVSWLYLDEPPGTGIGVPFPDVSQLGRTPAARVFLRNTIVAGNVNRATHSSDDCRQTLALIVSEGGNVDTDDSCYLTQASDRPQSDPKLERLTDNGGLLQTHALGRGSSAWGIGTACPGLDERGRRRPGAPQRCDSGAYEAPPVGVGHR